MTTLHIAQFNIARMKAPLDDALMAGFTARLDEINALADQSPGFVWRLQTPAGNATYLRPYDDDRILVNMSVWETIEHLQQYVYHTAHAELLRQRHAWFEKFAGATVTLWWVPAGHIPTVAEAVETMIRPCEKDGVELCVTVPPDLHIEAGPDLFCQVLLNLMLNARRAMTGHAGRLSITATVHGTAEDLIEGQTDRRRHRRIDRSEGRRRAGRRSRAGCTTRTTPAVSE